jgi:hypothetical protein
VFGWLCSIFFITPAIQIFMTKLHFLFLVLLISALYSCKETCPTAAPAPQPVGTIFPLTVGNQWEYAESNFDSLNVTTSTSTHVMDVLSQQTIGNTAWFLMRSVYTNLRPNGTFLSRDSTRYAFALRSDGLWFAEYTNNRIDTSRTYLMAKFPAALYDSFSVYRRVTQTAIALEVPAGRFVCYQYRNELPTATISQDYIELYNISAGKGIIQGDNYRRRADGRVYVRRLYVLKSSRIQ